MLVTDGPIDTLWTYIECILKNVGNQKTFVSIDFYVLQKQINLFNKLWNTFFILKMKYSFKSTFKPQNLLIL